MTWPPSLLAGNLGLTLKAGATDADMDMLAALEKASAMGIVNRSEKGLSCAMWRQQIGER